MATKAVDVLYIAGLGGPIITHSEKTTAVLHQLEELLCPVTLARHHQVNLYLL